VKKFGKSVAWRTPNSRYCGPDMCTTRSWHRLFGCGIFDGDNDAFTSAAPGALTPDGQCFRRVKIKKNSLSLCERILRCLEAFMSDRQTIANPIRNISAETLHLISDMSRRPTQRSQFWFASVTSAESVVSSKNSRNFPSKGSKILREVNFSEGKMTPTVGKPNKAKNNKRKN